MGQRSGCPQSCSCRSAAASGRRPSSLPPAAWQRPPSGRWDRPGCCWLRRAGLRRCATPVHRPARHSRPRAAAATIVDASRSAQLGSGRIDVQAGRGLGGGRQRLLEGLVELVEEAAQHCGPHAVLGRFRMQWADDDLLRRLGGRVLPRQARRSRQPAALLALAKSNARNWKRRSLSASRPLPARCLLPRFFPVSVQPESGTSCR